MARTEDKMSEFLDACKRKGFKLTHQRMEIYRELAASEEHPDAETLHHRVSKRIPTISRDTVYRNLKMLAAEGLISVVGMSHERLRFDANMETHHHFVCARCGLIRDFRSCSDDSPSLPNEAKALGSVASLHLEARGICNACQKRKRR